MCQLINVHDRNAFNQLYRSYSAVVFAEISRLVKHREPAEDLLQEVFTSIWQKSHLYDMSKGSPYTWMMTVARNRCIDYLRKPHHYYQQNDIDVIADEKIYCPLRKLEVALVYKRLKSTRPLYLELFRLVYMYGYTLEEASIKCQVPVGTVKTVMRRLIKAQKQN